jgi:hypothetical protein
VRGRLSKGLPMPRLLRQLLRARLGLSSVIRATAAPGGLQHSHTWRYGSLEIRVLDPLCSRTEEEDTEWNQEKRRAWIVSQEASACERFVSPSQESKKTIGLHLGSEGLGVHIKGRDEDDERRRQYHVAGGRRQRQQFLLTARELHTHTCLQTAMARSKIGRLPITMQQGARTHIGHAAHEHSHEADEKAGEAGERVLKLGLWGDILLTIGKGTAGYVSGSKAIIADAAHSLSDIVCFPYLLFLLLFLQNPGRRIDTSS